jgi:CheY-like chemotaxis protein
MRLGFLTRAIFMETVLTIADERTTPDSLTELLGKDGRAISRARDGQEALERLTEVPRRLILLDLSMPRIDAWESLWRRSVDYKYSYDRFVGLRPAGRKAPVGQTYRS